MARLIEQVAGSDQPVKIRPDPRPPFERVMTDIGRNTVEALQTLIAFVGFFGHMMVASFAILRDPRRFRVNSVIRQFETVGVNALGIIGLMSFLIGIVTAQDRKSVVSGKRLSVRVDLGGRLILKKKLKHTQ